MEDIYNSIINGQRKQALSQLIDSGYLLEDLFIYLIEEGKPREIINMYRVALNNGYITFSKEQ